MGIEITISNSRVTGFGKGVRSVPGQAIGPDRSTSLSDRPMTREKWTGNGAESCKKEGFGLEFKGDGD